MIASGGVSGGFSSMIAGGNFMDGFRQGIIVAGLNHVASMASEEISRQRSINNIKNKYPRFYEVLSKLQDYLTENPKILDQLSKDSGVEKAKILEYMDIKSPEGQVILLKNFSKSGNYGESGYSSPYGKASFISASFVLGLERASLPTTIQGTSFLLATTVLHEFVHWGRASLILSSDPSANSGYTDYGDYWESKTFGTIINKNNAYEMSIKYKWKF